MGARAKGPANCSSGRIIPVSTQTLPIHSGVWSRSLWEPKRDFAQFCCALLYQNEHSKGSKLAGLRIAFNGADQSVDNRSLY